ncbi:mandelate racemase/muconate lactonizing enzyme family protein [Psychromarinibacter sp. S121]|uniref:mandelate racemase/muconate lactonizing enzyme family protein n=1 Tax=Psychromarinibacter sp. S121 TaxID=3415127 RepID=UPI003C7E6603
MKVTAIETIWNPAWSNFLWVRVETDEGITGLGETFRHAQPIATYLHSQIAGYLLGRDPRATNAHADALLNHGGNRFSGYPTRSVEIRANSAVDIALWDIRARALDVSVCELMGGPVRDSIPIYNTCAGPGYNWAAGQARARMAGDGQAAAGNVTDDLDWQERDPAELAESLLDEGITAMKIWPFDKAAEATRGHRISGADLRDGLQKLDAIRTAVDDRMDVMLEYHGLWRPAPARRILQETDRFKPFWHEDIVSMTEIPALAELRAQSTTPFAGSENHGTAVWVRDALAARALDYVHYDIGWIGGLSEALRVAYLTSAHDVMIAPHDCTGPVVWIANLHLSLAMPNALILESVRAFYKGIYPELVTHLPQIANGTATAMDGPGLGTELSDFVLSHPDTQIQRSAL